MLILILFFPLKFEMLHSILWQQQSHYISDFLLLTAVLNVQAYFYVITSGFSLF